MNSMAEFRLSVQEEGRQGPSVCTTANLDLCWKSSTVATSKPELPAYFIVTFLNKEDFNQAHKIQTFKVYLFYAVNEDIFYKLLHICLKNEDSKPKWSSSDKTCHPSIANVGDYMELKLEIFEDQRRPKTTKGQDSQHSLDHRNDSQARQRHFRCDQLMAPCEMLRSAAKSTWNNIAAGQLDIPSWQFQLFSISKTFVELSFTIHVTVSRDGVVSSKEIKYETCFYNKDKEDSSADMEWNENNKARDKLNNHRKIIMKNIQAVDQVIEHLNENNILDENDKTNLSSSGEKIGELLHILICHKNDVLPSFIRALESTKLEENINLAKILR